MQALGPSYSWSLTGVPDIDQVRGTDAAAGKEGLPNNGKMWCLPTSGADILAYLADLGYNTGIPSKDWTLDANYNEMSAELLELGTEMNADPVKGTGGTGFVNAMAARLTTAGSQLKTIDSQGVGQLVSYAGAGWKGPDAEQMALAGLDGALTTSIRGKYKDEPDPDGQGIVKRRTGGHMMAGVGASGIYGAGSGTIRVRDPATEYVVKTVQTPYATDSHAVGPPTSFKVIYHDNADDQDKTKNITAATWDGSETNLWEGYYKIVPNTTWVQIGPNLKRLRAYELVPPGPGPLKTVYDVPGKKPVSALALSAASPGPVYLVEGSNQVRYLDPVTGGSQTLANVGGAHALDFGGPSQRLFVAGGKKLVALDGITGAVLATERLKKSLAAVAFDESAGLLVGLTSGGGRLQLFDEGLHSRGARTLGGLDGKGKPFLDIAPNGKLFVGQSGSPSVFSAKPVAKLASEAGATASRAFELKRRFRTKQGIHGLTVDDLGHVLVAQGGKVKVFDKKGHRLRRSRFAGKASAVLAVTRTFSNADPNLLQPTIDFLDEPDPRPGR
jgi:hypothetical protein